MIKKLQANERLEGQTGGSVPTQRRGWCTVVNRYQSLTVGLVLVSAPMLLVLIV